MSGWFTLFTNCRYILNGELVEDHLVISDETGLILKRDGYIGGEAVDLEDGIIAPGFLELHTNGANGFHFTHFDDEKSYAAKIDNIARYYATQGVTGFYATIPTVKSDEFQKILPSLTPRAIPNSASLLGAHVEGPYLHPTKKGAHNASLFAPSSISPSTIYGSSNLHNVVKLVTLAPELPDSSSLIKALTAQGIKVSMGHSTATYEQGLVGLNAGASCLTHTLNAMPGFGSREPGLAGLISLPTTHSSPPPYYSVIADGQHLHPNTVSLLHRANPRRAVIITDSIELASLADGTYPGHAQIPFEQTKAGDRATIAGTDTLIGGCIPLQQSVRNLMEWSGCGIAEAVGTVTENVAGLMGIDGEGGRGVLKEGRRADLTVMSDDGELLQTWIAGVKVWDKEDEVAKSEADGEVRG
ncbi:N-acetylglucosamine-6-phosphate deacetylase [Parastagonospora nodorum]|nr:N-acetylglucosamine-6-phosphate deacetylase [Parastagonospora nodorum]KAH4273313.1 N-acetylglucosamine-6-phosphate deacetylase [Parastagonospora nodorum]KAH5224432.1 N-acetylglucosamine-6-phosphate deacetylase [Parastagonospora nodorum]KAH5606899.1 N-acetylglucosamine-6-phosphate deacetylase [Parastagonospora nodorum]KAH6149573.1 N-acetylglucosamine-6-phosphate deacetylase [Parastagonospora nodorum]